MLFLLFSLKMCRHFLLLHNQNSEKSVYQVILKMMVIFRYEMGIVQSNFFLFELNVHIVIWYLLHHYFVLLLQLSHHYIASFSSILHIIVHNNIIRRILHNSLFFMFFFILRLKREHLLFPLSSLLFQNLFFLMLYLHLQL